MLLFGDLDWPLDASRGFVSTSWASRWVTAWCKPTWKTGRWDALNSQQMNGTSSTEHSFKSHVGSGSKRHCLLGRDVISEITSSWSTGLNRLSVALNLFRQMSKSGLSAASVDARTPAILSMKNLCKSAAEMSGDPACVFRPISWSIERQSCRGGELCSSMDAQNCARFRRVSRR